MKNEIQIIDLPALHAPIQNELNDAIAMVMQHQQFINGPEVQLFEKELGKYLCAEVVGVGNGTDALEIALLTLGVGLGDEVLVPSFSYYASAEVIIKIGAIPVFVDVDETFTIHVVDAESKITHKTKAVIAVHLFGLCANMQSVMDLANSHDLKVVEDTAQAIGAMCCINGHWKKAGTIGDMGCVSFFPSKNLGAFGDGGAIVSSSIDLLAKAKMMAQHGQSAKYVHDIVGMNSRLDTFQAAVLRVKLPYLNSWTAKRKEIASQYKRAFQAIEFITLGIEPEYSTHVYHQFTLLVLRNRSEIMGELKELGVPVRLYYPKAIHQQKACKEYAEVHLPKTEHIQSQMISLPIHPTLTNDQVQYTIDSVLKVLKKYT